ncbi:MAG: type II toxin-antitoxin system VapC family toxin [Gammaproteobacteria bacterium]
MVALRYLLDTNILSEPLKPAPNAGVLTNLKRLSERLATAAPVWHELTFGAARLPVSERRAQIQEYLDTAILGALPIIPYDERAAAWHGRERARLEALGKTPSFTDGQVAAVAAVNQLTLVTRNADDFRDFEGLRLENWFAGRKKVDRP